MKKILLSAAFLVAMAAAGLGGYSYYQQSQIDPAILENIEALSNAETGGGEGWWESKVYNCIHVEVWEFDCYFYKNLPIGAGEIYVGRPLDPYDICCGYFKRADTDCVAGNQVAHCWNC